MSEEKLTLGEYFRSEREKGARAQGDRGANQDPCPDPHLSGGKPARHAPAQDLSQGFLRVISREFNFDEEELLAHLEETLASHETINKQVKEPSYRAKPVMPMIVLVAAAALIVIVLFVFSLRQCTRDPLEDKKTGAWIPAPVYACVETGDRVFS